MIDSAVGSSERGFLMFVTRNWNEIPGANCCKFLIRSRSDSPCKRRLTEKGSFTVILIWRRSIEIKHSSTFLRLFDLPIQTESSEK